jgi:hypothetical protein
LARASETVIITGSGSEHTRNTTVFALDVARSPLSVVPLATRKRG